MLQKFNKNLFFRFSPGKRNRIGNHLVAEKITKVKHKLKVMKMTYVNIGGIR